MPNIYIEDHVEQERWDCTNKYNKWEEGEFSSDDKPKQIKILENNFCNDIIRKDEVVNTSSLGSESLSLNCEKIGVCVSVCLSPTNKDGVYVLYLFLTFYAAKTQ
jgi:hypothetical protein